MKNSYSFLHKGLFAEGMTGRRTFITNLNEQSDEVCIRENMRKIGILVSKHTWDIRRTAKQKTRYYVEFRP
jgi:hypothetical protein